jgi:hypothetical protein
VFREGQNEFNRCILSIT